MSHLKDLNPLSCFSQGNTNMLWNSEGLCYPGFDLKNHDSHFMILVEVFTNHILAESTKFITFIEWIGQKIMVSKPANRYEIIQHCYNFKNIFINGFPNFNFSDIQVSWLHQMPMHETWSTYYWITWEVHTAW